MSEDQNQSNWLREALKGKGGLRGKGSQELFEAAEKLLEAKAKECAERLGRDVSTVRGQLAGLMQKELADRLPRIDLQGQTRAQVIGRILPSIATAALSNFHTAANQAAEATPSDIPPSDTTPDGKNKDFWDRKLDSARARITRKGEPFS